MEHTATYILSQLFFLINYIFLMITYQLKNRKLIILLNFGSCAAMLIAYILLGKYAGLAMVIVSIVRNIIFVIDEKINGKNEHMMKKDFIIMFVLLVACALCAIPTYECIWSLAAIGATMSYTISVCQKNVKVYRCWST